MRAKPLRALGAIVSVGCLALVGCSSGSEAPRVTGPSGPSTTLVGLVTETMKDGSTTSPNVVEPLVEVVDDAVTVVFEQVSTVEGRVRECVPLKVKATPDAVVELLGKEPKPAAVSLVRACERAIDLADGWTGDADRGCVARELSSTSEVVVQAFHSSVVAPENKAGSSYEVKDLSKRLKECGT